MRTKRAKRTAETDFSSFSFSLLLLAVYMLAFADRQLPAMLAGPIAHELRIGDAALGALHGFGFALLYAVAALPAGWLVDRVPRLRLLAACLLLWSAATIACAFAQSLAHLAAARMAVGLGQAALVPAAYSLLGDAWPRERTGVAVAGFAIGPFLGAGMMLVLGGRFAEASGWRLPFVVAGLLGMAIAFVLFRLPEPSRHGEPRPIAPAWNEISVYARLHIRAILAVDGSMLFTAMAAHAVLSWSVVWLMRVHDLALGTATLALGTALIAGGVTGTLGGGVLGDRLFRDGRRGGRLRLLGMVALIGSPIAWMAFTTGDIGAALGLLTLLIGLVAIALASGPAALQDITPPRLRGAQHGLAVFLINIFGLGLGPLIIGVGSEMLTDDPQALGTVLARAVPAMLALAALIAACGARWHAASARLLVQATAPGRPSSTV